MTTTRDRALEAALALVGEQGMRALTHARVDERGGLPRGSTSNWFRTRAALLAGVITWLAESERAEFAAAPPAPIDTPDELIDALSAFVHLQTGPRATRTRARYALFLDAAGDDDLLAPLLGQRALYVEWMTALLERVGAAAPAESARTVMAASEGLVFHRLTVDPDAAVHPVIGRAVRASLT